MNKVLLGVRGLTDADAAARVINALRALKGVGEVTQAQTAQLEVTYDPARITVMDLLRAVRAQGFLAGML
jgi:hypothetical protein